MTIPFFDGHNDTLLRLQEHRGDKVEAFVKGTNDDHIDLPRARSAGMVGGFFAMFPPPLKTDLATVAAAPDYAKGELPPQLALSDALQSTNGMASLLLRLERAGALAVCRSAADIRDAQATGTIAAIFHLEGAEAIDTDFNSLEVLYAAGLRSIGITWSRANAFGTGVPFRFPADPDIGPGLSDAGKSLVRLCDHMGVMIDLSHLNAAGFRDVASLSSKPLVATHSNVHAICQSTRNLVDWQLAAIRESKGVVGLNYATGFLRPDGRFDPNTPIDLMVQHIAALVETVGEDGVALGSDFDGAMMPAEIRDVAGVPKLLQALLDHGFGEPLVRKIALDNWLGLVERTIG
ncbi:dipeptidase AC. Metallo peptidase. MEROPS family M19 [Devosia lucknowensis]|uniref:Dipeptidase AC. Metallo peptidase. MEROPS family M19 n=1 Tax=Devosia lucknowensis TaxID=1096929 RepID=A0A1Y6EXC9_9HYPH|nr:dipeptidase [Devosia lucknowensis]SMQ64923.1 dipeptidase AC. Metallo peptidase. MEROPS family M19 [Devosia lucknowensis]